MRTEALAGPPLVRTQVLSLLVWAHPGARGGESTAPHAPAGGAIARAAVPALWGETAPAIPAAALKNTDSLRLNVLCLFS